MWQVSWEKERKKKSEQGFRVKLSATGFRSYTQLLPWHGMVKLVKYTLGSSQQPLGRLFC
jgi:hypothetical protein